MMLTNSDIHSYEDARRLAKKRLPRMIFDYIDGAAGTEHGEQLNRNAIRDIRLQPRILNNVEKRSIKIDLFGEKAGLPFGISPMGMCNLARHDADTLLAQFAAKHKVPVGVSTAASTSLEDMITYADGHAWFQLYFSGNKEASFKLIDRAKASGYKTLVLTVDVPEVGRRPRELRRGFKMPFKIGIPQFIDFALHPEWSLSTLIKGKPELANFGGKFGEFDRTSSRAGADWDLLSQIRERWQGNLVIKGVLSPVDAVKLKDAGVDAIQVSSHGGRQLDSAPAPINALREIRKSVGDAFTLFFDSGLRSGEDIIKAYAYGADYVLLGRPFSYAIAANGKAGLDQYAALLASDISVTLAQLGLTEMSDVNDDILCKH
jgi:isopentenyl diphosphate isomerase/L-lactate dehydrogenase-like FMN-dependent dehydrogenase